MGMGGWSIGVLKGRDEREQGKEIAGFGDGVRLGSVPKNGGESAVTWWDSGV